MTDIHEYIQNAMSTYYIIQFFMAYISYFFHNGKIKITLLFNISGLSSLDVPGHTQILTYQLTLFQPGRQIVPTRIFRPSDGPAFVEIG